MIKYALQCKKGHEFEAWFSNSQGFTKEQSEGRLSCPHCGSKNVEKALMAPRVRTTKGKESKALSTTDTMDIATPDNLETAPEAVREAMTKVREYVEKNADYVGGDFAEEARKIHYEETEARGIYGEATLDEVKELHDEGIDTLPLPSPPEKQN